MIKSMTGFGRGEAVCDSMTFTAEIRSVNHRYCEISVKLPRRFNYAEDSIKTVVKQHANRGKIEVNLSVLDDSFDAGSIHLNIDAAKAYFSALKTLNEEVLDGKGTISLQMLATNPDILRTIAPEDDEEKIISSISEAVEQACLSFDEMRSIEGEKLMSDILGRCTFIEDTVTSFEVYAPGIKRAYYDKLKYRINDMLSGNVEVPEERIMVEAAMFADKVDVTEEITRLKSHCNQLRSMAADESNEPIGKKLDFLVQELNRESNTIGSKCNDVSITQKVLQLKNEIEKIREQVQNIE